MKIEIGESVFYSWLRHVKECQIVQTNWKVSSQWQLSNASEIEQLMKLVDSYYSEKYDYHIFKGNTALSQLLQQGECDALGISVRSDDILYYAVDVAFHKDGLNYKDRAVTVMKVLEKCARTAFCLYGYLSTDKAEIIFSSPKITPAILKDIEPCIKDLNMLFRDNGYHFTFRIIANEDFYDFVIQPVLSVSDKVADTAELFLRSYQMYTMFTDDRKRRNQTIKAERKVDGAENHLIHDDVYHDLKIGKLAQRVLGQMLSEGCASEEEIAAMQTPQYSKQRFDIQYPLLKLADEQEKPLHYYAKPIDINGTLYYLCCEWFEKEGANNDRPYLLSWIKEHKR